MKAAQRETVEERFRVEIEGLKALLTRQGGQLSALADQVRRVEEGGAVERKLVRNEEEIGELRRLVQVLERRVGGAVVAVVGDSVGGRKSDSDGEMTAGWIHSLSPGVDG